MPESGTVCVMRCAGVKYVVLQGEAVCDCVTCCADVWQARCCLVLCGPELWCVL